MKPFGPRIRSWGDLASNLEDRIDRNFRGADTSCRKMMQAFYQGNGLSFYHPLDEELDELLDPMRYP